jgi:metal-responsive CopG/Arc/MetJ family transcriptional regulator
MRDVERIMVQLDPETLDELDEAAREASVSRSAAARQAIETALAERRRRLELEEVLHSFRRRPQEGDTPVPRKVQREAWPE